MTTTLSTPTLRLSTTNKPVWVVGAGYLGLRLTRLLDDQSRRVLAIRRHSLWDTYTHPLHPTWQPFDGAWHNLCDNEAPEAIVIAWSPSNRSIESYRECYLDSASQLLRSLERRDLLPQRIIHISSASTLGGTDGQEVDELSSPLPHREHSLLLRAAEENISRFGLKFDIDVVHLKLAGIYGPDRLPGMRRLNTNTTITQNPYGWINLVHVDDAVSAANHALNSSTNGAFIVSSEAVQRKPFYESIQRLHRTPSPKWSSKPESSLGRRLDSKLFKTCCHWQPRYPSAIEWMTDTNS